MTPREIFKQYQQYDNKNNAAYCAALKFGISPKEVKEAVKQHRKDKEEKLVTYKIMKKKRQGLRLVRVTANGQTMDWYTDRDEKGIKEFVESLRHRMKE
jgi:NCAIR mutase (PurE)-related protein